MNAHVNPATLTAPIRPMTCVEAHVGHYIRMAALRSRAVELAAASAVVFWVGWQVAQLI